MIRDQLSRIGSESVDADDLRVAKKRVAAALASRFRSASTSAKTLAQLVGMDLPVGFYQELIARIERVDEKELRRSAHACFDPKELATVVVENTGPASGPP